MSDQMQQSQGQQSEWTIVAQQGIKRYLVVPTEDADNPHSTQARVVDVLRGQVYPAFNLQSILGQGYWEDYTGDQDADSFMAGADLP